MNVNNYTSIYSSYSHKILFWDKNNILYVIGYEISNETKVSFEILKTIYYYIYNII